MHTCKAANPSASSGSQALPPTGCIHVPPAEGDDRFIVTLTTLTPDPSSGESPVQGTRAGWTPAKGAVGVAELDKASIAPSSSNWRLIPSGQEGLSGTQTYKVPVASHRLAGPGLPAHTALGHVLQGISKKNKWQEIISLCPFWILVSSLGAAFL